MKDGNDYDLVTLEANASLLVPFERLTELPLRRRTENDGSSHFERLRLARNAAQEIPASGSRW
jgi:hypothetical protein